MASAEFGNRRPLIPGQPDKDLSPQINRAIAEGPEFLNLSWLDKPNPRKRNVVENLQRSGGIDAIYILDGAVIAPLIDVAKEHEAARPPYGLVRNTMRIFADFRNMTPHYQVVSSFHETTDKFGNRLNPFLVLQESMEDTLEVALTNIIDRGNKAAKHEPDSPAGNLFHRFGQMNEVSRQFFEEQGTMKGSLFNGLGTGTKVPVGILKIILDVCKIKYDLTPETNAEAVDIYKELAKNSFPFLVETARLDKDTITDVQQTLFINPLYSDTMNHVTYYKIDMSTGRPRLDLEDDIKEILTERYLKRQATSNRRGCPFMAAVYHKQPEGVSKKIAGITQLWNWIRPLGEQVYDELHPAA